MKTNDTNPTTPEIKPEPHPLATATATPRPFQPISGLSRRSFLKRTGGAVVAVIIATHLFKTEATAAEGGNSDEPIYKYGLLITEFANQTDISPTDDGAHPKQATGQEIVKESEPTEIAKKIIKGRIKCTPKNGYNEQLAPYFVGDDQPWLFWGRVFTFGFDYSVDIVEIIIMPDDSTHELKIAHISGNSDGTVSIDADTGVQRLEPPEVYDKPPQEGKLSTGEDFKVAVTDVSAKTHFYRSQSL